MMKIRNNYGLTLVEIMVVMAIFVALMAGVVATLFSGQDSWSNTDGMIQVNENLRIILARISKELRNSGADALGVMQIAINDGGGVDGSDVIQFSIPVSCETGGNIIDANGDVAYWGAPLTWGCDSPACMDADDDCVTVDYKYVQYSINGANQLLRTVLDEFFVTVREDIFAQNIIDFQAVLSGDQDVVTLTVSMQRDTSRNRPITNTSSLNVFLRNK
jgi:prepilin-type N-terminal cleavage/methylation domain-containing protein